MLYQRGLNLFGMKVFAYIVWPDDETERSFPEVQSQISNGKQPPYKPQASQCILFHSLIITQYCFSEMPNWYSIALETLATLSFMIFNKVTINIRPPMSISCLLFLPVSKTYCFPLD